MTTCRRQVPGTGLPSNTGAMRARAGRVVQALRSRPDGRRRRPRRDPVQLWSPYGSGKRSPQLGRREARFPTFLRHRVCSRRLRPARYDRYIPVIGVLPGMKNQPPVVPGFIGFVASYRASGRAPAGGGLAWPASPPYAKPICGLNFFLPISKRTRIFRTVDTMGSA